MKFVIIPAAALLVVCDAAQAQIYVLENEQGKSIIVPPGIKDPEAFIIDQMKAFGGGKWRTTIATGDKVCVHRRSITYLNGKPTRWVQATGATRDEAEKNGRDAVMSITQGGSGHWQGLYCNKAAAALKKLDASDLEQRAINGRQGSR